MFDGSSGMDWDGIVIARDVDDYIEANIDGLLVGGLDANNFYDVVRWMGGRVRYNACHAYKANESLSYLELMPNTIHETN